MKNLRARLARLYELDDHPGRILPMEGLRGVAVLLVFVVHIGLFRPWVEPGSWLAAAMDAGWQMGHAGVDLFFVLSGYLIYGAVIRRPTPYGRFMGRRLRRIYPVFLTVFAVYVLLDLTIAGTHRIPSEPWPAIGYLLANLALLPGIVPIDPLLTVAWSLSFEFFYYLTIPLAVVLLRMRRWQPRQRLLFFAGVALAGFAVGYFVQAELIRLVMFLAGILVYELLNGLGWRPARRSEWFALAVAVVAVGSVTLLEVTPAGGPNALALPAGIAATDRVFALFVGFGLLCLVAFRASGPLYRLLAWTPLRWLGNMSYSFYLVHSLAFKGLELVLGRLLPAGPRPPIVVAGIVGAAFVLAWVAASGLYALVERPFSLRPGPRRAVGRVAAEKAAVG